MIHYHGTPAGGTRDEVARFLSGRHALVPWVRAEDIGTAAEVCQSFMLDNGAFTAWKSGKPISDWSGYYQWALLWCKHPSCDFAVIPDVIDGTEDDNNRLIAKWHESVPSYVQCAPVWHLHESLDRLRWICDSYKLYRVALGSSGEYSATGTLKWWNRMAEAMQVICDDDGRPMCRLHGLRMLDPAIFHRLPLASADSTNASRNSSSLKRFGMYCPPARGARAGIIADRVEKHQSAAVWIGTDQQSVLARE